MLLHQLFPGTNYADYAHLSSDQAVWDAVTFVLLPKAQRRLYPTQADVYKETALWITYYGSYPSMLSGWSHLLSPDTTFAANASSALVGARLDFMGYHDKMGIKHQHISHGVEG